MTAKSDILFLVRRIDTFLDLVQDPDGYFDRNPDAIFPGSKDGRILGAAMYLLVDCFLRGEGIKYSSMREMAIDRLDRIWHQIEALVAERPGRYPQLEGCLGRAQAVVELDWMTGSDVKLEEPKEEEEA